MLRRFITIILPCVLLSACANYQWPENNSLEKQEVKQQAAPDAQPQGWFARPVADPMETMGDQDPSVHVFSLKGNLSDPFTRSNLQPLSEKVIGEGYVANDPSVTVYPPRLPTAIPTLAPMAGVRVDATSSLYSAKVQAMAKQQPRLDPPPLPIAPISEDDMMGDMAGTVPMPDMVITGAPISSQSLPPVLPPVQEIELAPRATAPVRPAPAPVAFTGAGAKSAPVNTGYGAPATPTASVPSPVPMEQQQPVTSFSLTGY